MSIEDFVTKYREMIDSSMNACQMNGPFDDDEREQWVESDEGLYLLAQSEGVDI